MLLAPSEGVNFGTGSTVFVEHRVIAVLEAGEDGGAVRVMDRRVHGWAGRDIGENG